MIQQLAVVKTVSMLYKTHSLLKVNVIRYLHVRFAENRILYTTTFSSNVLARELDTKWIPPQEQHIKMI